MPRVYSDGGESMLCSESCIPKCYCPCSSCESTRESSSSKSKESKPKTRRPKISSGGGKRK